jgi:peptide/nickel transport system ATP-binding protein
MNKYILKINNLSIGTIEDTKLILVDDISFSVKSGKTTCIVGESGSGKSLTALSIIRLLSPQLKMSGEILYNNEDICKMSEPEIREKRGLDIAMIFQEPMTSLNPVLTIGYQIKEAIAVHSDLPNNECNCCVTFVGFFHL